MTSYVVQGVLLQTYDIKALLMRASGPAVCRCAGSVLCVCGWDVSSSASLSVSSAHVTATENENALSQVKTSGAV